MDKSRLVDIDRGVKELCECPVEIGIERIKKESNLEVLNTAYNWEVASRYNDLFIKHLLLRIEELS